MDEQNVDHAAIPESERWFSVIVGGMLILSSLRRRDLAVGALFAAGGSALVFRGIVGHDGFFRAVGRLVRGRATVPPSERPGDRAAGR